MADITLKGTLIHSLGALPQVGSGVPAFDLVGKDLAPVTLDQFAGTRLVLNIVPSIDTGICAASARRFNVEATALANTKVLTISMDLPFAAGRFCAAEGIENVVMASAFRSTFGTDYQVVLVDGPLKGLLSRAVIVLDESHKVIYTEQVPEIVQEPDYAAALAALGA